MKSGNLRKALLLAACLSFLIQAQATAQDVTPPAELTVHGRVIDVGGNPVKAFISVASSTWEYFDGITTSPDGTYSVQAPARRGYYVQAQPAERVRFGEAEIPTGFLDQLQYVPVDGAEVTADFSVTPAGALWLKTYDTHGTYLFQQDKHDWIAGIYPLGEAPAGPSLQYLNRQSGTFWGWQDGMDRNHVVLLVPVGQPVELWLHWPVPGVGDTFIHMDHDGRGFTVEAGAVQTVNVLYEAARTEARLFRQRLDSDRAAGYTVSDEITARIAEADAALHAADSACASAPTEACIQDSYTVLGDVVQSREALVLEKARQDIHKFRQTDVRLALQDCSGAPLAGVPVTYQQTSQDFILAAGWPEGSQSAVLKDAGFNSAAHEAWWGEVMPAPGQFDFQDGNFRDILGNDLKIVMHTGVWLTPNQGWYYPYPKFITDLRPEELAPLAEEYSRKVTAHYRDDMLIYNAYNEPQNAFQLMDLTEAQVLDIAAASVQGARAGAPDVPTYINGYNMYLGDLAWPANFHSKVYPTGQQILMDLLARGVPFDQIGLEFYNGVVGPTIDLGIFDDTLEHYGVYGKPVFISELSYGTNEDYPNLDKFWYAWKWHGGHTDQAQADWAVDAMTIAFSKPYVSGVMWVSASEVPAASDYAGDALFDAHGQARPVVGAIKDLTHSWLTSGSGTTDSAGTLTWRGFRGDYTVSWSAEDGNSRSAQMHVSGDTPQRLTLRPDDCNSPSQATPVPAAQTSRPQGGFLWIAIAVVVGCGGLFTAALLWLLRALSVPGKR